MSTNTPESDFKKLIALTLSQGQARDSLKEVQMKNWFTIGQFSQKIGVSAKALRLYEKMGLIQSHTRGENGYRYYDESQLELAQRLKSFKDLGFTLSEIKSLLQADQKLNFEKIIASMEDRLGQISDQMEHLTEQKRELQNILTSLKKKSEPLKAQQRRAIMSFYGKVSIVVTGDEGLKKTAEFTQQHFSNAGQDIPIIHWSEGFDLDQPKPYILVIQEAELASPHIDKIHPDIIVIKGMKNFSSETKDLYLRLYNDVGPNVTTVINADDRASVSLVADADIRKTWYVYFSKNKALKPQIKNIGGIISDGEEIELYGFNKTSKSVHLKLKNILPFNDEVALLSSLGAVMAIGLKEEQLKTEHLELNS